MARPRIPIDWAEFDKLCAIQCTQAEIAAWFKCTDETIENACKREHKQSFSAYYKTKAANGKMSLRRKQMQVALDGNVAMLIWLGKQTLGQRENPVTEQDGNSNGIDSLLATLDKARRERREDV